MALTSVGPDIALARVATTGKFDFDMSTSGSNKGNPKLDASRTHMVVATLFGRKRGKAPGDKVESGGYYWDLSGRRGTLLWTVTQDRNSTRSQLVSAADDGLRQLVDEKQIVNFPTPDAQRIGLHLGRWGVVAQWSTPSGDRKEALRF
jgi:hypothetical protein